MPGVVIDPVVVVAISGPDHVNVGTPAPPNGDAVSDITPPAQNGLLALETRPEIDGCVFML